MNRQPGPDRVMEARPFVVPRPIARANAALPRTPPAAALCLALNLARDRVFPADVLRALEARRLQIRVLDAGLTLDFTVLRGWFLPWVAPGEPDLVIAATAHDFLQLALRKEDPDTLFFARRLVMQGDTGLGLLVKNTLDAADFPAPTLADLAPHRVLRRLAGIVFPRRS